MSLKFDHTLEKLSDCMGMPLSQLDELTEKLTYIAADMSSRNKNIKKSHIAEQIAEKLSYSELVFVGVLYIEFVVNGPAPAESTSSPSDALNAIIQKLKGKK